MLLALVAASALVAGLPEAAVAAETAPQAERVFVFSMPTVSWAEANDFDLPHLSALLDESAIGGLSTRAVDRRTTAGDGYVTLNAGTRADGDPDFDGLGFEVGEPYLGEPAEQIFTRRTGTPVESGLFSLALPALEDTNEALDFGAEVGALGDALREGDAAPAVIATADGTNEEAKTVYARQAVIGLMDGEGLVPGGRVGDDLLEPDPEAPFGHRLDQDEVVAAFDEAWSADRAVVLVEASDLVRADAYRVLATREQRDRQRAEALVRSDDLLGRLLERVDPATDAVMVVGPYPATGNDHLTLAALRAPGVEPGLLKSAVTRRSGFVTMVDVAPTILSLLDIDLPDSMEGRRWERAGTGGTAGERRDWLEQANAEAQWRDDMVALVATLFVVAQLVLWVVAAWTLSQESARGRHAVEVASLAVLAVLPLTYFAGAFPFHEWGAAAFWAYLIGGGALLGFAAQRLLRAWPADPLIGVLFLMLGVLLPGRAGGRAPAAQHGVRLHAHGGRALRRPGQPGLRPAGGGGHDPGRPAGVSHRGAAGHRRRPSACWACAWSSTRRRSGAPTSAARSRSSRPSPASPPSCSASASGCARLLLVGLGTSWSFVTAGFIDLARPEESRTHLGRLFEDIGNDGFGAFETVVFRKLGANFAVLASSEWTLMLPVVFAFILYLIWRAPGRLQRLQEVIPQERAARVGFVIAAILGLRPQRLGHRRPRPDARRDERLAGLPRPPHRGPPLEGRDRRRRRRSRARRRRRLPG